MLQECPSSTNDPYALSVDIILLSTVLYVGSYFTQPIFKYISFYLLHLKNNNLEDTPLNGFLLES